MNIIIEYRIIKTRRGTKFQLKLTILIFSTRFAQKGFFGLKQKKWTPHIFYIILHIQISLVRSFSSNWQFRFFGPNLSKKVFPVENRKSTIILGSKFQLKLIILSLWNKFTQKRYFQSKTEQTVHGLQAFAFCVVNVNSTVVFKHFEDLKDFIILFWTFWKRYCLCLPSWALFILKLYKAYQTALCKQPWLVKPWLNFDLNFSFKFLYNFAGQLKKWWLWSKILTSTIIFSTFTFWLLLFFHDW